jgi:hypothetical protein
MLIVEEEALVWVKAHPADAEVLHDPVDGLAAGPQELGHEPVLVGVLYPLPETRLFDVQHLSDFDLVARR